MQAVSEQVPKQALGQFEKPKVISGEQVSNAISSNTLMGYEFQDKGELATLEQGSRTPFSPVPDSSAGDCSQKSVQVQG